MRFNLSAGFPAVTTKKLAWRAVVGELLWFLEGSTDERRLAELTYGKHRADLVGKHTIWTANADKQGKDLGYINNEFTKELGPVYGAQWRKFNGLSNGDYGEDQIAEIINQLKYHDSSRRIILSAWNPNQLREMALPPCHAFAQFRVYNNKLSCQMYQRSGDAFLGIPFNIASYALLTYIFANECGLEVGDFIHTIGDAHIYSNHFDQVREQLSREEFPLPSLEIAEDFTLSDLFAGNYIFPSNSVDKFQLLGYNSHSSIKAEMAV